MGKKVQGYGLANVNATAHFIVIDKSNITDFPHYGTGPIAIEDVGGYVLGLALADVKIQVGVITVIDGTKSTIKWFGEYNSIGAGDVVKLSDIIPVFPITPELPHVSMGAAAGSTLFTATNADFDTATTHATPYVASGIAPEVGDIVMSITVTAGAVDLAMWLKYEN